MPSVERWISEGMDPVHAAYAFVQHLSSSFAEGVSRLPEMKKYAKIVGAAEDEYMPSGPPMSPLTASFFTTWAFRRQTPPGRSPGPPTAPRRRIALHAA
jgi:hypothetical protein